MKMPHVLESTRQRDFGRPGLPAAVFCGMAMILAASCALLFGLVGPLNLVERIPLMFAAAALGGGALYTILAMHRLGKED
jgi:hypothetical protein